jgi:hypothetical protein
VVHSLHAAHCTPHACSGRTCKTQLDVVLLAFHHSRSIKFVIVHAVCIILCIRIGEGPKLLVL